MLHQPDTAASALVAKHADANVAVARQRCAVSNHLVLRWFSVSFGRCWELVTAASDEYSEPRRTTDTYPRTTWTIASSRSVDFADYHVKKKTLHSSVWYVRITYDQFSIGRCRETAQRSISSEKELKISHSPNTILWEIIPVFSSLRRRGLNTLKPEHHACD